MRSTTGRDSNPRASLFRFCTLELGQTNPLLGYARPSSTPLRVLKAKQVVFCTHKSQNEKRFLHRVPANRFFLGYARPSSTPLMAQRHARIVDLLLPKGVLRDKE
ncbi:hypothetical protein AAC387_Pa02g1489 [Persea americana]